jgi:pimeloyl-ACP methyl ester carboxylesterase
MAQDPALDNLRHPPGTGTAPMGSLGEVVKTGSGPRAMVLIPGFGFGAGVWTEFMERHRESFTMYAVTLPGFGGTAPLPMPPEGSKYVDAPWTKSAVSGVLALLDREKLRRATLVAHWAVATQIALQLALDAPDRVDAVVIVGGALKFHSDRIPGMNTWTPEVRAASADGMAQRWFKTVTRRTWDDNNFMPYDYAINPRRGLFLWREAATPSLPVWIRYLQEFSAMDLTPRLKDLRVPTLVVRPGFDDPEFYVEAGANYMRNFCLDSWTGADTLTDRLEIVTIPRSRLFVMFDQPDELDHVIRRFLAR